MPDQPNYLHAQIVGCEIVFWLVLQDELAIRHLLRRAHCLTCGPRYV